MSNYLFIFSSKGSFRIIFLGAGGATVVANIGVGEVGVVIGGKVTPGKMLEGLLPVEAEGLMIVGWFAGSTEELLPN
jgi:hypothetical protein